jgi:hypothetical protein
MGDWVTMASFKARSSWNFLFDWAGRFLLARKPLVHRWLDLYQALVVCPTL